MAITREQRIVYTAQRDLFDLLDAFAEQSVSEVEMFGTRVYLEPELKFGDITGVQRYLDILVRRPWFAARFPGTASPTARESRLREGSDNTLTRSAARADSATNSIYLAPHGGGLSSQMRQIIVLHEVAHLLPVRGSGGHGDAFQELFLWLIAEDMSEQWAWLFRVHLDMARAKVTRSP